MPDETKQSKNKPKVKVSSKDDSLEIEITSNEYSKKLLLYFPKLIEFLTSRYLTICVRIVAFIALILAMFTGSLLLITIFGFILSLSLLVKFSIKTTK